MEKKLVLESFYNQIGVYLADKNFKISTSSSIAKKNTNYGFASLFFDVNDMVDSYSITTRLRIRNNIIQEIRGEINPRLKNRKETSTVLHTISSVLERYNRLDLEYEIYDPGNLVNEKTLIPYIEAFKKFMNEVGFQFLARFKEMKDFDEWFNTPVLENTFNFNYSATNDSVCGIIAAKLSGNPQYEEIYSKWITGILPKAIETLKELNDAKAYLDANF